MEDFNLPTLERTALLGRLHESIGDVPPHFWAACQICDLDALKSLVNCGREYPNILSGLTLQTSTMAHYWGPSPPRAQSQPSTPKTTTPQKSTLSNLSSSPATPPTKRQKTSDSPATQLRNQKARDLAAERDRFVCVLTRGGSIEVAHIYPFHSISHQEEDKFGQRHIFWSHLKNFWPKEKVIAWEAEIFPAGICDFGIDRVYNLITLSRGAHDMWARGAFALKPISESDDKTTLKVQFFWQKKQQEAQTAMSLLTTPFSTQGLSQNTNVFKGVAKLFREDENNIIRSGDYFTLQTDDPETKPLPSFTLLELQWFLQRIQGMAGAADVDWPSLSDAGSDFSDVELPDLELDEGADLSLLSSQRLSSPTKLVHNDNLNLPMPHKHQEAEGNGEGAEEGRPVAM
ncbi:hypothetical protein NA56DRAFT_751498 [Hyaloscypha hepaticicola]|uniref:HNH nuclease domain-containing protein n=1 Tax=Hyaloscypha hepaticicola TaxID=2082293 RepID=A0A2J6PVY3_9HELO|nr:hypothetical protein NA56DRAFT_751498 [Hyaloscypha hepaticicola]